VQNCYDNHPKANLVNNVVALFKDEEVDVAKAWLYNFVDNMTTRPDGIPRRIRRQGDNKKKQDCEDLLGDLIVCLIMRNLIFHCLPPPI